MSCLERRAQNEPSIQGAHPVQGHSCWSEFGMVPPLSTERRRCWGHAADVLISLCLAQYTTIQIRGAWEVLSETSWLHRPLCGSTSSFPCTYITCLLLVSPSSSLSSSLGCFKCLRRWSVPDWPSSWNKPILKLVKQVAVVIKFMKQLQKCQHWLYQQNAELRRQDENKLLKAAARLKDSEISFATHTKCL